MMCLTQVRWLTARSEGALKKLIDIGGSPWCKLVAVIVADPRNCLQITAKEATIASLPLYPVEGHGHYT